MEERINKKFVVVITLNYNHAYDTIKCVDSLLKSTYTKYKIMVVDNGSEDNDYTKLLKTYSKEDKVKVIRIERNKGYVGGVNYGLESALQYNPDYFLIMNNDTVIDEFAMEELVITGEKHEQNAIVQGKVYNMDEPETLQYVGQYAVDEKRIIYLPYVKEGREKDIGQFDEEKELGMADDIFWLLPRKIFNKVGYYSKYFFLYGEQNDYALRVKKEGFKLIYIPKAKLWHIHHLTTGNSDIDNFKVKYWQNYSSYSLYYLHMNRGFFYRTFLKSFLKINLKMILNKMKLRKDKFIEPQFKAVWVFVRWLFVKSENMGYNPYE